jgi:dynein heavy chain, axonemal
MVEKWLLQVEEMMTGSLKKIIQSSIQDYEKTLRSKWVIEWPGQVVICVSQVYWTKESELAIQTNSLDVNRISIYYSSSTNLVL